MYLVENLTGLSYMIASFSLIDAVVQISEKIVHGNTDKPENLIKQIGSPVNCGVMQGIIITTGLAWVHFMLNDKSIYDSRTFLFIYAFTTLIAWCLNSQYNKFLDENVHKVCSTLMSQTDEKIKNDAIIKGVENLAWAAGKKRLFLTLTSFVIYALAWLHII